MRSLLLTLLLFAPGIASSQAESLAISLNQGRSLHVAPGGSSEFDIAITRPVGYPYPGGFWSIYDPQAGLGGPSPLRFHIGQRIEGRCDYIPLLADFAPIPNLVGILGAHSIAECTLSVVRHMSRKRSAYAEDQADAFRRHDPDHRR
jgi:hypothetical protein